MSLGWWILISARPAQWKHGLKVDNAEAQPKVAKETACFHIIHHIPLIFLSSEPCHLNASQSTLSQACIFSPRVSDVNHIPKVAKQPSAIRAILPLLFSCSLW